MEGATDEKSEGRQVREQEGPGQAEHRRGEELLSKALHGTGRGFRTCSCSKPGRC